MNSEKQKRTGSGSKKRLNVRIPEDLLRFIKDYAQKKGITVTSIIVDRFQELRRHVR